jgi:hypothetical protein
MRTIARLLRVALLLIAVPSLAASTAADELADFHSAIEEATSQYRVALLTLETHGPEDTAAEVVRLRAAWQAFGERFGAHRPAAFADDEQYGAMFTILDAQIVGALIVINAGRQDAARKALAPIGELLADLSARSAGQRP